ncbi:MAG: putative two-component sensor histidine kinase protein [Actinomycetia bacterium]|nr:putative two-component sensor histidine kinase protein [Actinomycetes bacterium]
MVSQVAEIRGNHAHHHVVGFYATDDELVAAVTAFLNEGLDRDAALVVVATAEHRLALDGALVAGGHSTEDLTTHGRYQSLDAAGTLATFVRDGTPDAAAFASVIGTIISDAGRGSRPVYVFGEMVALLWDDGNVAAAIELESFWNDLATRHDFTLYCGYRLASVEAREDLASIKQVCDRHSNVLLLQNVVVDERTLLGRTDTDSVARMFVPAAATLRGVRQFVTDVLASWGEDRVTDAAGIVANELATNAVVHANSPFRLTLSRTASSIRIAVCDTSASPPEQLAVDPHRIGGNGVAFVAALSHAWGTEETPGGKTVWAELAAT